jgi:hypothetical protein
LQKFAAGGLHGSAVLLPRSWLVCLWGESGRGLHFQRLDDLVVVYRAEAYFLNQPAASAVFIDRHGVRVEVVGTVDGVTCLLAEVLPRVPWALNRFDPATERAWNEGRDRIIADVDRRRDHIQGSRGV